MLVAGESSRLGRLDRWVLGAVLNSMNSAIAYQFIYS